MSRYSGWCSELEDRQELSRGTSGLTNAKNGESESWKVLSRAPKRLGRIFFQIFVDGVRQIISALGLESGLTHWTKRFESQFRKSIDLRNINAATFAEWWPMLIVEIELGDFQNSKHFSLPDVLFKPLAIPTRPEFLRRMSDDSYTGNVYIYRGTLYI